jgi:hypothetical protein
MVIDVLEEFSASIFRVQEVEDLLNREDGGSSSEMSVFICQSTWRHILEVESSATSL